MVQTDACHDTRRNLICRRRSCFGPFHHFYRDTNHRGHQPVQYRTTVRNRNSILRKSKMHGYDEAFGLCFSSMVYIAATCLINFSYFGMHTAILISLVKFVVSTLWLCTALHFTEPEQSRGIRRSLVPTISTPYSPFSSGVISSMRSPRGRKVWRPRATIKVRVYMPATNAVLPND